MDSPHGKNVIDNTDENHTDTSAPKTTKVKLKLISEPLFNDSDTRPNTPTDINENVGVNRDCLTNMWGYICNIIMPILNDLMSKKDIWVGLCLGMMFNTGTFVSIITCMIFILAFVLMIQILPFLTKGRKNVLYTNTT